MVSTGVFIVFTRFSGHFSKVILTGRISLNQDDFSQKNLALKNVSNVMESKDQEIIELQQQLKDKEFVEKQYNSLLTENGRLNKELENAHNQLQSLEALNATLKHQIDSQGDASILRNKIIEMEKKEVVLETIIKGKEETISALMLSLGNKTDNDMVEI